MGIYPKPSKSAIIVNLNKLTAGKDFGLCNRFKVCTGTRYLGGFIGDDKSKLEILKDRRLTWEKKIRVINKTAGKYTQES